MAISNLERGGFFSKQRITAPAGFNRWLVPPAALAIHLCIGMAYGFSVFWLPLSRAVGIDHPLECPQTLSMLGRAFASDCDWKVSDLGWMFTLFFVFLGSAAALWGGWLERVGPRLAGVVSAACWCGGLVLSAVGVYWHQLWLLWVGSGIIGGIGLGLGYISPVSTLIKWFPDRRGMATGMAIMGFGGGAMIGAPLADRMMKVFATPHSVGVWQTFLVLAGLYGVFMLGGACGYRLPREGWRPTLARMPTVSMTTRYVPLTTAWRTRSFWLVWGVLCMNVTAGIGILGMASPLLQEVFGGRLIGVPTAFADLSTAEKSQIAAIAAGFTGLLSLFNIAGRFFWASLSDAIGRKTTYTVFFALGIVLYATVPWTARSGSLALFVAGFCLILSMYGGGFATVPAYLADLFGTRMVGAIHGRLLTAWSTAGVLGPVLVNYVREYQLDHGVARAESYSITMYILAGLLVIGLLCNWAVRPVRDEDFVADERDALAAATDRAVTQQVTPAQSIAVAPGVDGLGHRAAPAAVGRHGHTAESCAAVSMNRASWAAFENQEEQAMSTELTLLGCAIVLGLAHVLIAATLVTQQRGLKWNAGNRDGEQPPVVGMAARADRASRNFLETFPFFAVAILGVVVAHASTPQTVLGAKIYLWARLLYLPIYIVGIPYLRTLVWAASLWGMLQVLYALF